MKRFVLALSLLPVALWCSNASAATYLFYVPQPTVVGTNAGEVYVPVAYEAHDGMNGASLADASLKELGKYMKDELAALKVTYKGNSAEIVVDKAKSEDPKVADRALGAVFHTLRLAGVSEVRIAGGETLDPASFSRGALLPVVPIAAALPPRWLAHGYVLVGASVVPAGEFYRKLNGGDSAIRDVAVKQLTTGSAAVKLALLAGYTSLRLPDPDAQLVPLLTDKDDTVRLTVLDMLGKSRNPKVLKALEGVVENDLNADAKIAAVKVLVAAGKTEFKKYLLLEKLKSNDDAVVLDAARAIINTGDGKLAPALVPLAKHSNPSLRRVAVRGLTSFKSYAAMARLLDDEKVNADAAQPLARDLVDNASGVEKARGAAWLLTKGDAPSAIHAAGVCGSARLAGTTEALGKALSRSEPDVRAAAAKALGELKDTAGLEPLAAAVKATSDKAERAAFEAEAIRIIAVQPLPQVIKISESTDAVVRELAIKSLAEFSKDRPNPQVISVLKSRLKDSEVGIRRAAAFALARIKDPAIVGELVGMAGDSDPGIRAQVAFALAGSNHPKADELIIKFIDDSDDLVKLEAVKGVRKRKIKAGLEKIKWLVEYRQPDVRREVLATIYELSEPTDDKLFDTYSQRLYDDDPAIRKIAIDAIARYKSDARTPATIGAAVTDANPAVKIHALETLLKFKEDPNAVEQAIRGLFDRDKAIKLKTLDVLEQMASPKALKALQEFLSNESDADVKKRAEDVMSKL